MTTAKLSVGLNTAEAKEELRQLRQQMEQMRKYQVELSFDGRNIDRDVERYFKQRTFKFKLATEQIREIGNEVQAFVESGIAKAFAGNGKARELRWAQNQLEGGIKAAVNGGFNDPKRRLGYDRVGLQTSVREDILAGVAQAAAIVPKVHVQATAVLAPGAAPGASASPAASGLVADVRQVVNELLGPAVAELSKAASLVGGVARKAGLTEHTSTSKSKASKTAGYLDPNTGERVSVRTPVGDAAAAMAEFQALRAAQMGPFRETMEAGLVQERKLQAERDKYGATFGPFRETMEANLALERKLQAERDKYAASFGPFRSTFDWGMAQERKLQVERDKYGASFGPFRSTMEAGLVQERKLQAERDKYGASFGPFRSTFEWGLAQERKVQAERDKYGASFGPFRSTMEAGRLQEQKLQQATRTLEMARFYEAQKLQGTKDFKGAGPSIFAADQTAQRFGVTATQDFLGKKSILLDQTAALDNYRRVAEGVKKPVGDVAMAHRSLNESMREGHALARGLAGSMGMLWTTYGAVVPLVAAAAIGSSLRQIFTVGKDVEYQLAFVSALSENTVVSVERFGQALKGSMVGPKEASEALRGLAQNGLSVAESMRALPTILNLATAGEMSLSEAALGATGVMAAFSLSVHDLGRVSDVFAKAAASSNTSVTSMIESMRQASTVGDQFNVSLEETGASLATLAQRNITGSAAGTAFRNMMTELAAPSKKAQEAFKMLGIELFDKNKQFVGLEVALHRVRDAVLLLDEPSRISFLTDVFNERGMKAANTLISDLDTFKEKLVEVKDQSAGFTQFVTDQLGASTAGNLKKLMAEFQTSAESAFNASTSSANSFINTLRQIATSQDFQETLRDIADGVLSLTRFLQENGRIVAGTVAAWMGFRALSTVVAGFVSLRAAIGSASVAMAGFGTVAARALGLATGGITVVTALVAEYFLLKNNTDGAARAQDDLNRQLELANLASDARVKNMMAENDVLSRQVELMWQGVSAAEAKDRADDEGQTKTLIPTKLVLAEDERALAQNLKNQGDAQLRANANAATTGDDSEIRALQAAEKELRARIATSRKAIEDGEKIVRETQRRRGESETLDILKKVEEFNRNLEERRKLKPGITVAPILKLDDQDVRRSSEDLRVELAEKQAKLNTQLGTYKPADKAGQAKQESEAHKLAKAEYAELLQRMRDSEREMEMYQRFRKELDDARYNPDLFGPYLSGILAENRAIRGTTEAMAKQKQVVDALREKQNDPRFNAADRVTIDKDIAHEEAKLRELQAKLRNQQELARLRGINDVRKGDKDFSKELADASNEDVTRLDQLAQKFNKKQVSPRQAAIDEQTLKVEEDYRKRTVKHVERANVLTESLAWLEQEKARIIEESAGFDIERIAEKDKEIESVREALALEETRLAVLRAQGKAVRDSTAKATGELFDKTQTASAGWERFWEEYRNAAESNSTAVYNMMQKTTTGMTDMFQRFVETGKLDFKSFARSIIAEAAKIMASRAVLQLLTLAGSMFGPSAAPAAAGGGGAGIDPFGSTTVISSANGNIMTSTGPVKLKSFADGGIARGRMISEIGEGSRPEAYVPLPDGRSIPVTVQGGGGVNVNLNVYVQEGGETKTEARGGADARGREFADLLKNKVIETILEQQRPGGVLSR